MTDETILTALRCMVKGCRKYCNKCEMPYFDEDTYRCPVRCCAAEKKLISIVADRFDELAKPKLTTEKRIPHPKDEIYSMAHLICEMANKPESCNDCPGKSGGCFTIPKMQKLFEAGYRRQE